MTDGPESLSGYLHFFLRWGTWGIYLSINLNFVYYVKNERQVETIVCPYLSFSASAEWLARLTSTWVA